MESSKNLDADLKEPVVLDTVLQQSARSHADVGDVQLSWKQRWIPFFKSLSLEYILFLYTITFSMRFVVTQELFIAKSCLSRYPRDLCDALAFQNTTVRDDVTRVANLHNLLLVLAEFVPAAVMSVFLSSWYDRHGNRVPLLLDLTGAAVLDAGTILTVVFFEAPMYVNVLLGLVCGMTGGIVCMTAIVESSASTTSREDMRAVKFLFVMSALLVGVQIGQMLSGELFSAGGYLPVYSVSVGIIVFSIVSVLVFNVGTATSSSGWRAMLSDLRLHNFKEGYDAAFGWRPNGVRHQLVLLVTAIGVILFNAESQYPHDHLWPNLREC